MAAVSRTILERLEQLGLVPRGPAVWGGEWGGDALAGRGTLRLGLADERGEREACWIGRSLWSIPETAALRAPWYAVVSSRIGRHPERRWEWFRMLERAIAEAGREGAVVAVAEGTAGEEWVCHACGLFRVPTVAIRLAAETTPLEEWLHRLRRGVQRREPVVEVSPPVDGGEHGSGRSVAAAPRRDRAVVGLADRVFALHVREGGNLQSLLVERMRIDTAHPHCVRVGVQPVGRTSVRRPDGDAARRLVRAGAVGWFVSRSAEGNDVEQSAAPAASGRAAEILTLDAFLSRRAPQGASDPWPFLVHCTRAPDGPWPDQTMRQYRDELTLGSGEQRRGPLAALARILRQRVLWNSARLVRGQCGVVCWSAVPLGELLRRRTYRSHLGRWDYEPYGVAIGRTTLASHGARPVRYGTREEGERLPAAERTFFQPVGERVDWTQEREWRIAAPVRLGEIPAEEAFAFVPVLDDARQIASISPWPVVVVP